MNHILYDPTGETSPTKRPRQAPPTSLEGKTIMLFDIGKSRSDEFLDHIEVLLQDEGLTVLRAAKPTNVKTAPKAVIDHMVKEADVVVEALSD